MKHGVGVALVVLCLAPACGGSAKKVTRSYLASTPDTVVFVHWTRSGNAVRGWVGLHQTGFGVHRAVTSERAKFRARSTGLASPSGSDGSRMLFAKTF
jgi:hypothetical protein